MTIEIIKDARPVQDRTRRYPPNKREFLEKYTTKLLEYGLLKTTNITEWIAAPLIVPKAPPANFELTEDLRLVNDATKPIVWRMPNLDAETSDMKDSKFFASIEFVSGYWQLPMAEESQPFETLVEGGGREGTTRKGPFNVLVLLWT